MRYSAGQEPQGLEPQGPGLFFFHGFPFGQIVKHEENRAAAAGRVPLGDRPDEKIPLSPLRGQNEVDIGFGSGLDGVGGQVLEEATAPRIRIGALD